VGKNGEVIKGAQAVKMDQTRFAYNGTPDEYVKYIRQVLFRYQTHFEDIWRAVGQLKAQRIEKIKWSLSLGGYSIVQAKKSIAECSFPLRFKDGSVFTFGQTIHYEQGICWIEESVIRFIKVDSSQQVQYLFHYDSVMDVPDHPDHHLQFEYDPTITTPRFNIYRYESIESVLEMIVRDEVV
jgi:hypothetical protein